MRGILVALACLLAPAPALAQQHRVQGPYQLGMSVEDARGAWRSQSDQVYIVGTPFTPSLAFADGALDTVRYTRDLAVVDQDECAAETVRVVMLLEGQAAFAGAATGREPLDSAAVVTRTSGGSIARNYAPNAAGEALIYANRHTPVPTEVVGAYTPNTSGGKGSTCVITLSFSRQPLPPAPGTIDPPRIEELAAAETLADARFIEQPNAVDYGRWYPSAAMRDRIEGRVTLECLVRDDGYLRCAVATEEPAGLGFGQAAQTISARFRVEAQAGGAPTAGKRIRRTVVFRLAN